MNSSSWASIGNLRISWRYRERLPSEETLGMFAILAIVRRSHRRRLGRPDSGELPSGGGEHLVLAGFRDKLVESLADDRRQRAVLRTRLDRGIARIICAFD